MKKWLQVVFLSVLVIGLIAACGKSGSENTSSDNQQQQTGGQTQDNSSSEPAEFSISLRTHTYKYVESHPNINEDKWVKELGNRTNTKVDIRLIPHQEYVEKMNLMMASGDIPDVVNSGGIYDDALANAVQNDIFMPLDDLLEQYGQNLLKIIPEKAWDEVKHDGKIYGIPEYLSVPSRRGAFIRKDYLDKFGLDIPDTLDDYLHVMRTFKANGIKYPYSGREQWMYSELFLGAFNADPTMYLVDGDQLKPAYIMPQMKDALAFHRMIYEEGLMDPEFLTNSYADWERKIVNGDVGIFIHNYNLLPSWQANVKAVDPNAELAIIPQPLGVDGKRGVANYSSTLRVFLVNQKAKNPEAIIKFFDWMVTDEAAEFFNFGIEGETYTKNNGIIDYTYPIDDENKRNEEDYRNYWLWLVKDGAYNKMLSPYMDYSDVLVEVFENIAPYEGREWYNPRPLEGEDRHPELRTSERRQDLWQEYAAKIVLGQLPLDAFDEFVDSYYKRGGDKIIEEATRKYKDGSAVLQ